MSEHGFSKRVALLAAGATLAACAPIQSQETTKRSEEPINHCASYLGGVALVDKTNNTLRVTSEDTLGCVGPTSGINVFAYDDTFQTAREKSIATLQVGDTFAPVCVDAKPPVLKVEPKNQIIAEDQTGVIMLTDQVRRQLKELDSLPPQC